MNRKGFLCYISSLRFLDLPSEAHCLLTGRQKSYGTLISGNFPQTTIRALQMPLCTAVFFCGLLSLILELAKGFVPVFLGQRFLDTHSLLFIPVLIAPVFGHAFHFPKRKRRQSNYRLLWSPARSVSGDASGSVPCIFLYFLFPDRCGQPTFFPVCRYFWTVCIMRAVYRKSSIHPDWKLSDRCGRDLPAFYQIPRRAAPHTAFQTYSIASRLCCFFLLHTIQLTSTGLHVRPPSQAP